MIYCAQKMKIIEDELTFWARKLPRHNKLSDHDEDLMAAQAPAAASQANIFALWPAYCWEAKQDD